jgi:hypothetical protein
VKIRKKWLVIVSIPVALLVLGWFLLPSILKHYINRLVPGVEVGSVKLLSLDCVKLERVSVKIPNIEGNFDSAIACRKAKTVSIDGGLALVTIAPDSKDHKNGSGFKISGKNLTVKLYRGLDFVTLYKASFDSNEARAATGKVETKYGLVWVDGVHYDFKSKVATVVSGRAGLPGFLHKVSDLLKLEEVKFTEGSFDTQAKHLTLGNISYPPVTIEGLDLTFANGLIYPKAKSIQVEHKRFYPVPVTFRDVEITAIDPKDPLVGMPKFSDDLWVKSKWSTIYLNWEDKHVWGVDSCQHWLESIPEEMMIEPLKQVKLTGDFKFDLRILPEVKLKISNGCKLTGPPPKFIKDLAGEFSYTAYHPNGKPFTRKAGPSAPDWTPYQMISPNMTTALTTTEDPGFFYHRGFIPQAIENSLKDNLKLGRFFRGGSTITMQLAKNLWLNRSRTIGRKIQEAILTVALESSFSKDKIIEMYLNIVEYGPDIYGIGPASYQILKKDPLELTLSEALYMVLRLPRPNHSASYEHDLPMIKKLLDMVAASGKVAPDLIEVEKSALGAPVAVDLED